MVRREPAAQTPVISKTTRRRIGTAEAEKWTGRPLAAQRHLAASLMAVLTVDFKRHGAGTVTKLRVENPTNYLRLVASLLPKDLDDENLLEKVSDEELFDVIVQLRALAANAGEVRGPVLGAQ